MRSEGDRTETEIDEYLWPLTGDVSSINWGSVAEELRIRQRLAEIIAHVREHHVEPRLRRLGAKGSPGFEHSITASVITGPESGPPWAQALKEPVPRALRDEWQELAARLRELTTARSDGSAAESS